MLILEAFENNNYITLKNADFARLYYETFKKQNIPIIRIKPLVFQTFELNNHFFFFLLCFTCLFSKNYLFSKVWTEQLLKSCHTT